MYIELLIVDIDLATSSYKTIFFFFGKCNCVNFSLGEKMKLELEILNF